VEDGETVRIYGIVYSLQEKEALEENDERDKRGEESD